MAEYVQTKCVLRSQAIVAAGREGEEVPYSGFLSREKTFANCLKVDFRRENFRKLLENRFSQRKLSRICGNLVHHAH